MCIPNTNLKEKEKEKEKNYFYLLYIYFVVITTGLLHMVLKQVKTCDCG